MCCEFNADLNRRYSMEDFLTIMEILRAPGGCAWDREQTHKSIRREFLEETYEAIEAIDTDDTELLREELGDVLLQIVFHSQIEKENGNFNFDDVVNDICKKLIIRHPHVFSGLDVKSTDEILTNWDKIKIETKGQKNLKENIESISKALPALMRYQKFIKKADKYQLIDIQTTCDISIEQGKVNDEDIGKALAKIVAIAQLSGIDAEQALANVTKAEMQAI